MPLGAAAAATAWSCWALRTIPTAAAMATTRTTTTDETMIVRRRVSARWASARSCAAFSRVLWAVRALVTGDSVKGDDEFRR